MTRPNSLVDRTGWLEKTILSIGCRDSPVSRGWGRITGLNGTMFLTSAHRNAGSMVVQKGNIVTAHTTNLVPFVCTDKNILLKKVEICQILQVLYYNI